VQIVIEHFSSCKKNCLSYVINQIFADLSRFSQFLFNINNRTKERKWENLITFRLNADHPLPSTLYIHRSLHQRRVPRVLNVFRRFFPSREKNHHDPNRNRYFDLRRDFHGFFFSRVKCKASLSLSLFLSPPLPPFIFSLHHVACTAGWKFRKQFIINSIKHKPPI